MVKESIEAIVARIDERTANMQEDIVEMKSTCTGLQVIVSHHTTQLAVIEGQTRTNEKVIEEVKRKVNNGFNGQLSNKQKAGIGAFLSTFIASLIYSLYKLFTRN